MFGSAIRLSYHPLVSCPVTNSPVRRGTVRIIGGSWRGRRLPVPGGVRPTGDRVRETLFNWLSAGIGGSRCLDLFAGTGVLGLEAASRGAREVCLVDNDPSIVGVLRDQIERLGVGRISAVCADAPRYLASTEAQFDIIFVDPPFDWTGTEQLLTAILTRRRLRADGMIYLERPAEAWPAAVPGYRVWREKRAGHVCYGLLLRDSQTERRP